MWGRGNLPGGLDSALMDDFEMNFAEEMELERIARHRRQHDPERRDDPHLRSVSEILGYHLHATDGDIGHVTDLLVDEQSWAIRHLVVETGHWWKGKEVLIAPESITAVRWEDFSVSIDMACEAVKKAPRRRSIAL